MTEQQKTIRVLGLHGKGTSAAIFKSQTGLYTNPTTGLDIPD